LVGGIAVSSPARLTLNPGSVLEGAGGSNNWAAPVVLSTQAVPSIVIATADVDAAAGTKLTITGVISGADGLTTNGPGTVVVSARNTYTGGTVVQAGTLDVSASAAGAGVIGAVTVDSGATLGGAAGTTGAVTVKGGGKVSAGPLNTGAVTFTDATSIDQVTFGPTGPFALLTTGGVSLNGATLDVSLGSFKPVKGAQFTILRNGGGGSVTGHFSNPSTFTVGNTTFQIIYKTNEVDLKVV
jgi:fibronectin-binding autotransporter adhesin